MSDERVSFETQSSYRWLLPLMYVLAGWASFKKWCAHTLGYSVPNTNSWFFDGLAPKCRKIKEGAASWRALTLLYNHPFRKPESFGAWLDNVWLMSPNAQAVRNRRKIAKNELLKTILSLSLGGQEEVRILSLACGSAEAVLDAVVEANKFGVRTQCFLIDIDASALEYARKVAEGLGIADQVKTKRANLLGFERLGKIIAAYQPRIVEMMGLIDYVQDKHTVVLIKTIHDALPVGGMFFTCNIIPNAERVFLKHVINWEMIYRKPGELVEIMSVAGFRNIRTIVENMNIHVIAIGAKEDRGQKKIPERSSVPIAEGMLQ